MKLKCSIRRDGACCYVYSHSSQNGTEYPRSLVIFATICIFAVETARLGGASAIQASLIAFLRPFGSKRPEVERGLHEPCNVKR